MAKRTGWGFDLKTLFRKRNRQKEGRRQILKGAVALAAGAAFLQSPHAKAAALSPFRHGVASGDPRKHSVLLWTRIETAAKRPVKVAWEIAEYPDFSRTADRGEAMASPSKDYIIKVVAKNLRAGRRYFYRFRALGEASPIGRTRTLPKRGVKGIRLAIVSCANYNFGYFNPYRAIAAREDIDAVLHLGDYIYEYANNVYGAHPKRPLKPKGETLTLEDYRTRYGLYRSDPHLQALHRNHPMIAVWDDHEVANDSWAEGAQNHNEGEGSYRERQAAAKQAFFEWLPIRGKKIYRRFSFGTLAELVMLDTRHDGRAKPLSYRSFFKPPPKEGAPPRFDADAFDEALQSKTRRLFSEKQERFLKRALRKKARWTLLGNQVAFSKLSVMDISSIPDLPPLFEQVKQMGLVAKALGRKLPLSLDGWGGYGAQRQRVLEMLQKKNGHAVIMTGDTHVGWAADYGRGMEFGTPSVSSPTFAEMIPQNADAVTALSLKENPHFFFSDPIHRGYLLLDVRADKMIAQWYKTNAATPSAPVRPNVRMELPYDGKAKLYKSS